MSDGENREGGRERERGKLRRERERGWGYPRTYGGFLIITQPLTHFRVGAEKSEQEETDSTISDRVVLLNFQL